MTQEDKELLFKDLSARLPYGVIYQVGRRSFPSNEIKYSNEKLRRCEVTTKGEYGAGCNGATLTSITKVKPYLRPMSSMTEEEKKELINHVLEGEGAEYFHITHDGSIDGNQAAEQDLYNLNLHWLNFGPITTSSYIDWLNKNMFDYRGLIDKGLAIEVTEENNPYKN